MAIFYSHNKHFGYLLAGLFWFILKLFLLKSSYHRTALITFLLFNIFLSEFVVAMNSVENELALPHPKKLYQYPHRDTNQNKIDCLIRQGIKLKITPLQKLEDAISFFEQAADQGDSRGMCWIGRVCEEKENLELAVRWYALGFQNDWFKDSAKAYKSSSYEGLKRLTEQKSEIKTRKNETKLN